VLGNRFPDGEERGQASVRAEVREARLAEEPFASQERVVETPELLEHVLLELLLPREEDVPRAARPRLHLFEDPTFLFAPQHGRDHRHDIAPHLLLELRVRPLLDHRR